jgi:pseudomonalisin
MPVGLNPSRRKNMPRILKISSLLLLAPVLAASFPVRAQTQFPPPASQIHGPIVESEVVTLYGNTHPLARPEDDRGELPPETRLDRLVLLLQPTTTQQEQLDALSQAQQDPDSALYHRWLTPEEYGSRFGASDTDLANITAWLKSHGFTVEEIPASHRAILFSGTAGQVADTFHTQIHSYLVAGQSHIANSEDPQVPRAFASIVSGIVSLHDFRRNPAMHSIQAAVVAPTRPSPDDTEGSRHYLFPTDFATIYDLKPLYSAGQSGSGTSVAVVARSNINLNDVKTFRSYASLAVNQPSVVLDGTNPGMIPGDQGEATLDVEWAGAVAPAAAIKLVVAGSTATTDGVDLSAQYIVNHKTAQVMTTSFANCETTMGATELAFYNSLWQQAASEGISAFVASGDSGAAGCQPGSATKGSSAAVNGMCTSPYVTCVGGTEFNEGSSANKYWASADGVGGGSAISYIPEVVWNESQSKGGSGLWASGGGISHVYTQPSWQKGISGANSNGMRAVPDVSLTAAMHDGYLILLNGSWCIVSGTSAAAPSFAGILALVTQKQGTGQGNANPVLYGMLSGSANPFHATPSGNNSVPGVSGFTASGTSYNLATGLGSVDANILVDHWPAVSKVAQGFTLTPSVKAESLQPGASVTFTVTVAPTGGFTGTVALTATTPAGTTLTFTPASIKPGATANAKLTLAATTKPGSGNIAITGVGAEASTKITQTANVAVTIQSPPKPTLSLAAASNSESLTIGKTITDLITVSTGNTFHDAVTLSLTGLPKGVIAAWSTNPLQPNATTGSATNTLRLTANANAAVGTSAMLVTATGGGVSVSEKITLQVLGDTPPRGR